MEIEHSTVCLETLGGGAAAEMFADELQKIVGNINDPNTSATKARKLVLTLTLTPDERREKCNVEIECNSKLAPVNPYGTTFWLAMDREEGVIKAIESNPKQPDLPFAMTREA